MPLIHRSSWGHRRKDPPVVGVGERVSSSSSSSSNSGGSITGRRSANDRQGNTFG